MEPKNGFTNPLPHSFLSAHCVFFWLLLGLALVGVVWLLVGIVRVFRSGEREKHLLLLLLPLPLAVASAQEQPRTFRIPFHSVNGLILLDATVNGKPRSLILDTGAMQTQLDRKATAQHADYSILYVDLKMEEYHLRDFRILVTDLTQILRSIHHADGILGEDWLRSFRSVRIDYKKQVVELEE